MDRDCFDALTRLFAVSGSRRGALGALLGTALLGSRGEILARTPKRHRRRNAKGKGKGQRTALAQAIPARCYTGTHCVIGKAMNAANCDFTGSTAFQRKNLSSSNLSGSNLSRVDATNANFKSANLGQTCLVDATLTGANLQQANLSGAIFCRTIMPDGSLNNSGCAQGAACCPTCGPARPCAAGQRCCDGVCRTGVCCTSQDCAGAGATCRQFQCQCGAGAVCSASETCCDGACTSTSALCGGSCGNVCQAPRPHCCGQTCRECCEDGQCTNPDAAFCRDFQCADDPVARTFARVRTVIASILGLDENTITMESTFAGDLGADSLDVVELIIALEDEFGFTISDEDAENIRTVGDAVRYIVAQGG